MSVSSYLLVNGQSTLGRIVYKFEELSHALKEVGENTLSQRVAVYALHLFVAFPVLMAYTVGTLAFAPLVLAVSLVPLCCCDPTVFKQGLQEFVALIAFPLLAAGHLLIGKLPPTNPTNPFLNHWSPMQITNRLESLLHGFEGHAGYRLVKMYLESEQKMGHSSSLAFILKSLLEHQKDGYNWCSARIHSTWKLYPVYRALSPLIMQLTPQEYMELFSTALWRRDLPTCALLWTLDAEMLSQKGLRDTSVAIRKDLLTMGKKCEQLGVPSGQEAEISAEQGMEEDLRRLIGNETIFKIILLRLPRMMLEVSGSSAPLPPFESLDRNELLERLEQQPALKKVLVYHLIMLGQTIKKVNSKLSGDAGTALQKLILASTPLPTDVANIVTEYLTLFNTPIKLNYSNPAKIEPSMDAKAGRESLDGDDSLIFKLVPRCDNSLLKIECVMKDRIYRWHVGGSRGAACAGAIAIGVYGLIEAFLVRPIGLCTILLIATAEKILRIALNLFKFCFFVDFTRACMKKILMDLAMLIGGNAFFMFGSMLVGLIMAEGAVRRAVDTYIHCLYMDQKRK